MKLRWVAMAQYWEMVSRASIFMWTTVCSWGAFPDTVASLFDSLNEAADALESLGFVVSDRKVGEEIGKVIGYAPMRHPALLKFPGAKFATLHLAFDTLLAARKVYVPRLRSIIGFWLWMMLSNRIFLSIAHDVFQFIERFEGRCVEWDPKVKDEVAAIRDTLILCVLDLGAEIPNTVFAIDAMGANDSDCGGYAVVGASVSHEMAVDCWKAGPHPLKTVVRLDGQVSNLLKPVSKLEARIPICRLPAQLLDTSLTQWDLIEKGRWDFADQIELGVARATIRLLQLLAVCPSTFRRKITSLQETTPVGRTQLSRADLQRPRLISFAAEKRLFSSLKDRVSRYHGYKAHHNRLMKAAELSYDGPRD